VAGTDGHLRRAYSRASSEARYAPGEIRDFVYDQSELLGCDPGAMALTALAVCSSLISDEITIQPRRFDTTYRESARLWLMLIGLISNKKTPMAQEADDCHPCQAIPDETPI
jgi:hypothetical protein